MTYSHTTFSTILTNPDGTTSGIPISHMELTSEEKDVINLAFSDVSPFVNPLADDISVSISNISKLHSSINTRNTTSDDDLYGLCGTLLTNLTTLSNNLNFTSDEPNFLNHTNRLSGTSGGKTWLKNDGELYGFTGLQGVAGAFNSVQEAMKDEGDPVEDNYSIFFTSILTAGKSLMSDIVDFANDGDRISGITISELLPEDISGLETESTTMSTAITDNINADNTQLSFAVDYLKKFGHGNMILGMSRDTYFGGVLLDDLQSEILESELDDIN